MKKSFQKGFSLVELLVVVAIIGVLAGVGVVGYQSYTESAKKSVAEANFNSVKRFVETELTLLNNSVQATSAAIKKSQSMPACNSNDEYSVHSTNLTDFITGVACYFGTGGSGNMGFKNPFDAAGGLGVTIDTSGTSTAFKKGMIVIRKALSTDTTSLTADQSMTASSGWFVIDYYSADSAKDSDEAKVLELK